MPQIKRLLISQIGNSFIVSPCDPAEDISVLSTDSIAASMDGETYSYFPADSLLGKIKNFFEEKPPQTLDTDLQP